ncbi:MAG: response regulator [Myxococcales bacterium]|nr:response regulator [Myxococcales bacterium]
MSAALDETLDDEIIEALAVARECLGAELAIVSRIVGDRYEVEQVVAGEGDGPSNGDVYSLRRTYCAITLRAQGVVCIDDVEHSEHRGHPCYEDFGLLSYIGIPLRVGGEPHGTVSFSSSQAREQPYGVAERGLVELVGKWVMRSHERRALLRELQATAEEGRAARETFRALFRNSPDAMFVHRDGIVIEANDASAQLLVASRAEDLTGRALVDFLPRTADRDRATQRLLLLARGGVPTPRDELTVRRLDGRLRTMVSSGTPIVLPDGPAALTIVRDVTDYKDVEAQLRQSERLASVGSLAAGVAHEINNPLSYVLANLDVIAESLGTGRELSATDVMEMAAAIDEARHGARRAARIVRSLRSFSRVAEEVRTTLDLHDLLDGAIAMTKSEIRHRAKVVRHLDPVPLVHGDEARLTQVFVNLLVNAGQAIGDGAPPDARVTVTTRTTEDGWAEVTVADTGPGIAPEHMPRLFDPYFTTKPLGEGTGLGLALSHRFVTAHGGTLAASSPPGGGAVLTVRLPPAPADAPTISTPTSETPISSGRRGRVLVVDDDALVGRSIRRILGERHDVVNVPGGAEALRELDTYDGGFDVILCDMMMPRMQGWELYDAIERSWPALASRIIFISGGTLGGRAAEFIERVDNACLLKPFDMDQLRAAVEGVLLQARA